MSDNGLMRMVRRRVIDKPYAFNSDLKAQKLWDPGKDEDKTFHR